MTGHRDERLARRFDELEVPEHGPSFWARVDADLAVEADGRKRRRPRVPRRYPAAALAGAVALALLALVLVSPFDSSGTASAAEIARKVRDALASARTLSGEIHTRGLNDEGGGTFDDHQRFAITSDGDLRLTKIGGDVRSEQSLDLRRGVAIDFVRPRRGFGGPEAMRGTGLPPGPPDRELVPDVLRRDVSASVIALAAAGEQTVSETRFGGRDVWVLASAVRYDRFTRGRVRAVIDRDTALPLRIVREIEGRLVSDTRFERLRLNRRIPRSRFTVDLPPGTRVERVDLGFRRTPRRRLRAAAGYQPPLPTVLPGGFVPTAAAVQRPGPETLPTGTANPVAGRVVSVAYRRGFEQVTVTLRPTGPDPERWGDPFVPGEGTSRPQRRRLRAGALRGTAARIATGPLELPHLWAVHPKLVLTVAGPLSATELLRVAESLRR